MSFFNVVSGKLGKNSNVVNWESNDDLPINGPDVISGKIGKTPKLIN